jgi:hypothetical protein
MPAANLYWREGLTISGAEVMNIPSNFSDAQHEQFMEQGYLRLGCVLSARELGALQKRIDDIMLGGVCYESMRMQLYDEERDELRRTLGHEVRTLAYRRIDDLEQDPLFLAYMQHALYRQITRRYIGEEVAVFRSMFMNKPARWQQTLPWHQDVGQGWGIDCNPITTLWLGLDEATIANGCMQIVPGSHRHGVINEQHFLSAEEEAQYARAEDVVDLTTAVGEVILLHNFLLHRSGSNTTSQPRRAFSVTYMDAKTRTLDTGQVFPVVFGANALDPETVDGKAAELVQVFYG